MPPNLNEENQNNTPNGNVPIPPPPVAPTDPITEINNKGEAKNENKPMIDLNALGEALIHPELMNHTGKPLEVPSQKRPVIETYSADLAEALVGQQGAVIKTAIAEDAKKKAEQEEGSLKSPENKKYLGLTFLLIFIAIGVVGGVIYYKNFTTPPLPETTSLPPVISIIKAETQTPLDITNQNPEGIISSLQALVNNPNAVEGVILDIYPYVEDASGKNRVSAAEFLKDIDAGSDANSFISTLKKEFMLGIHKHESGGNTAFLILKTETYQNGLQGMLSWERTLFDDLYQLFGIDISGTRQSLFADKFSDTTIKNKDTRALKDDTGQIVLFYTFLDDTTLLITTSADTLEEVSARHFQNTLVR